MPINALTLADEDFKNAFVEGKFVIDCLEIKLTQNGKDNPAIYSSPGYFSVGPENGAESRIVFLRKENDKFDLLGNLRRAAELRSGRLIPESHYFRLEAKDIAGNLWTHPAASVKFQERQESITLTVNCDYLCCESPAPDQVSWTDMVLMEELEFPLNVLDEARSLVRGQRLSKMYETASFGKADNLQVTYDARKGRTGAIRFSELYAAPVEGVSVPDGFDQRLLEAVRFVTATMFWPVMTETVRNGVRTLELSKARPAPSGQLISPPLNPKGHELDFYRLLGCYYKYACDAASGDDVSPLSSKLGGLYTLKNVWIDTVALVVSVAIESIVEKSEVFKSIVPVDPELLKQMELMTKAIEASGADKAFQGRGVNLLSRMGSTGVRDKLTALAKVGALDKEDPEIWRKLRNTAAHGALHVNPAKLQKLLDNVYKSVTIVYKLSFMQIDYVGKYSDYSRHGWPTHEFESAAYWGAIWNGGSES